MVNRVQKSRVVITLCLVRITGLEPARSCPHMDLNHARLPIPPYPRDLYIINEFPLKIKPFLKKSIIFFFDILPIGTDGVFVFVIARPVVAHIFDIVWEILLADIVV